MNSYNVDIKVFGIEVARVRVRFTREIRTPSVDNILSLLTREPVTTKSSPLLINSHALAAAVISRDCAMRGLKEVSVMVRCPYGEQSIEVLKEIFKNKFSKINFHIFNENP